MAPFRRTGIGAALIGASALLGGCSIGSAYHRPAIALPAHFTQTPTGAAKSPWPAPDWWRGFDEPELDRLIARAMAHNTNLAVAAAQVMQADAALRIAGAPLLPSLGVGFNGSYTRLSGGAGGGASSLDQQSYSLTGGFASYELDLWGKLRDQAQAARENALASRFNQATVALDVVTSVASLYIQILTYQDRVRVAEANLADAEAVLKVINGQRAAGIASELAVAQQQTLVESERSTLIALRSALRQARLGLGILLGEPPENVTIAGGSLTRMRLPPVTPGLPAALLLRRPDIAAAEAQLRGAHASVRAARAAFFPTIALTGDGGWQSTALALLTGPGAAFATLSAGLSQTIFDNGARSGALEQERGVEMQLLASYRATVLQALTDVETALAALRFATDQEHQQRLAVAAAQRAATIARAQLVAGIVDVTTVLSTEASLYSAQDSLAQVRLARAQALINLYKALGGGWQAPPGSGSARMGSAAMDNTGTDTDIVKAGTP